MFAYQTQTVADTEYVGVDGEGGEIEDDGGDDVGGFASHAREGLEFVDIGRDLAVEVGKQFFCHADEVSAFVVGVGDGVDVLENLVG